MRDRTRFARGLGVGARPVASPPPFRGMSPAPQANPIARTNWASNQGGRAMAPAAYADGGIAGADDPNADSGDCSIMCSKCGEPIPLRVTARQEPEQETSAEAKLPDEETEPGVGALKVRE